MGIGTGTETGKGKGKGKLRQAQASLQPRRKAFFLSRYLIDIDLIIGVAWRGVSSLPSFLPYLRIYLFIYIHLSNYVPS